MTVAQSGLNALTGTGTNRGVGLSAIKGAPGLGSAATVGTPYNLTFIFNEAGALARETGTAWTTA